MRDAAEEQAARIFIRELRAADLTEKALRDRPRSEPLNWKITGTMRTKTTVSLGWIARRLDLGSASNVCHKMLQYSIFKSGPEWHELKRIRPSARLGDFCAEGRAFGAWVW